MIKSLIKIVYLLVFISIATATSFCQNPDNEIIFYSYGSTFSPMITVTGNAEVMWVFNDSSTSNSVHPFKNYGSDSLRINKLSVNPWSALKGINLGYDAKDSGTDTITLLPEQKVSKVENLELAAPYLEFWCSSYNMLDSLNFDNFINLNTIECYQSKTIKKVSLRNTPKLRRLCLEDNDLQELDISDCISLEDLRAAVNEFEDIVFSNSTEELWHICTRRSYRVNNHYMFENLERFPSLRELWIWDTNQTGEFELHETNSDEFSIYAHENNYIKLDLSGSLRRDSWAIVNFENNQLESVNVEGCSQIYDLYLANNKLLPDSVDKVLKQMDELGDVSRPDYRLIDLRGNSSPTVDGLKHKTNLEARGWTVYTESNPIISLTGNSLPIRNGDTSPDRINLTEFDSVLVNSGTVVHEFVIKNIGSEILELFGGSSVIFMDGDGSSEFTVVSQPTKTINVGDSTKFSVSFSPSIVGSCEATITISHNDWINNPFKFNIKGVGVDISTSYDDATAEESTIFNFTLSQNYPNPFNNSTIIGYEIPSAQWVSLRIYDILGKEVATLVNDYIEKGKYEVEFSTDGLSSGVYLYKLQAGSLIMNRRMILLK